MKRLSPDVINAMTPEEYKVAEDRLRRAARRQRMTLNKIRRRDPRAYDYGTYRLLDDRGEVVLHNGQGSGVGLDDVETFLLGEESEAA